jgi:hypothetical protein
MNDSLRNQGVEERLGDGRHKNNRREKVNTHTTEGLLGGK